MFNCLHGPKGLRSFFKPHVLSAKNAVSGFLGHQKLVLFWALSLPAAVINFSDPDDHNDGCTCF